MNTILKVNNLKTCFYSEDRVVPAVNGVSLEVRERETIGIVGESGCGKSVTSLSIMGLVKYPGKIEGGEILLDGKNLLDLGKKEMRKVRGKDISMIFQEPMTSLNPVYTVGGQLSEAVLCHEEISKQEAEAKAVAMLEQVSIPHARDVLKNYPHQLSGGMRQRVMIAMAMICQPKILIADEPTTALDVTIQAQILRLMKEVQERQGTSILFITHDLGVIAEIADYVTVMYAGKVVEEGKVLDIFDNPKHPYTIGLHRSTPKLTETRDRLQSIPGMVPMLSAKMEGCAFKTRCDHIMEKCLTEAPGFYTVGDAHKVRCWLHETKEAEEE